MNEHSSATRSSYPTVNNVLTGAQSKDKISTPYKPAVPLPAVLNTSRASVQRHCGGVVQHTSLSENELNRESRDTAYNSESLSSVSASPITSPTSSVDLEKGDIIRAHRHTRSHRHRSDPEKAGHRPARRSRGQDPRISAARLVYTHEDAMDEARVVQEAKAVNILLYFAFPCAILSTLNAGWTFLSIILTALTQPVRLCARRPGFGQQLSGLVGPALNLQLKAIRTPLPPHANEDTLYSPAKLIMVQMLSPFLSLGITLVAWVVAGYWVLTLIVGDPAGVDKRDDGREAALAMRDWWEKWLTRCVRES